MSTAGTIQIPEEVYRKPRKQSGLRKMLPRCENEDCSSHGALWPRLKRWSAGIRLHDRWYCGAECLERAATELFTGLIHAARPAKVKTHRIPLGLLLLSKGVINEEQLKTALQTQREAGNGRIGEWLRRLSYASEQDIAAGVAVQWGCPVFPLERERGYMDCARLLPLHLLESARMIPVYMSRDRSLVYLAFSNRIDHTTMYGVERMLECRTVPCVVTDSSLAHALDEIRQITRPNQVSFDSDRNPQEMARATRGYAMQLEAHEIRVGGFERDAWVRFFGAGQPRDLLFHLAPANA
jgi:hypothetical protein